MATETQLEMYGLVWNEGEEPEKIPHDGDIRSLEPILCERLETKTHAKVVAIRESETFELCYLAFTDPFRGRQVCSGVTMEDAQNFVIEMKKRFEVKVFTPNELYALKPVGTTHSVYALGIHVPEIDQYNIDDTAVENTKRVEVRELAYSCPDGRRSWRLDTVFFDGKPLMVVNASGRDGDEYHNRYITDSALFSEFLTFLRSHLKPESITDVVDPTKPLAEMTEFYNGTLHDYYDVDKQVKIEDRR